MKILLSSNVYRWKMTGILGKNGKWFFGYSTRKNAKIEKA